MVKVPQLHNVSCWNLKLGILGNIAAQLVTINRDDKSWLWMSMASQARLEPPASQREYPITGAGELQCQATSSEILKATATVALCTSSSASFLGLCTLHPVVNPLFRPRLCAQPSLHHDAFFPHTHHNLLWSTVGRWDIRKHERVDSNGSRFGGFSGITKRNPYREHW